MERIGLNHTKLHSKVFRRDTSVFPERSERFGLGSTTADETVRLLEMIARGEVVSRETNDASRPVSRLPPLDNPDASRNYLRDVLISNASVISASKSPSF